MYLSCRPEEISLTAAQDAVFTAFLCSRIGIFYLLGNLQNRSLNSVKDHIFRDWEGFFLEQEVKNVIPAAQSCNLCSFFD